jgi:hypothetical protein
LLAPNGSRFAWPDCQYALAERTRMKNREPPKGKAESLRYWFAATTQMISALALLIRVMLNR